AAAARGEGRDAAREAGEAHQAEASAHRLGGAAPSHLQQRRADVPALRRRAQTHRPALHQQGGGGAPRCAGLHLRVTPAAATDSAATAGSRRVASTATLPDCPSRTLAPSTRATLRL